MENKKLSLEDSAKVDRFVSILNGGQRDLIEAISPSYLHMKDSQRERPVI